jgi:hypothetical protein
MFLSEWVRGNTSSSAVFIRASTICSCWCGGFGDEVVGTGVLIGFVRFYDLLVVVSLLVPCHGLSSQSLVTASRHGLSSWSLVTAWSIYLAQKSSEWYLNILLPTCVHPGRLKFAVKNIPHTYDMTNVRYSPILHLLSTSLFPQSTLPTTREFFARGHLRDTWVHVQKGLSIALATTPGLLSSVWIACGIVTLCSITGLARDKSMMEGICPTICMFTIWTSYMAWKE